MGLMALLPSILIIKTDYIIFCQIASVLYFDNLQRNTTGVLKSMSLTW